MKILLLVSTKDIKDDEIFFDLCHLFFDLFFCLLFDLLSFRSHFHLVCIDLKNLSRTRKQDRYCEHIESRVVQVNMDENVRFRGCVVFCQCEQTLTGVVAFYMRMR